MTVKRFTYADYEHALRDDRMIADLQRPHVVRFAGASSVLDLGCGAGVFLGLLRDAGITGVGVDRDPELVGEARRAGHEVLEGDLFEFLRTTDRHFGGVFCSHLVEHVPFETVLDLVEGVARCLDAGGVFVAVFPNPESVRMHLSGFWKDPEHVRFYHPDLIAAVCRHYGLEIVGGSEENPAPHRLAPPWLSGSHLEGVRLAGEATDGAGGPPDATGPAAAAPPGAAGAAPAGPDATPTAGSGVPEAPAADGRRARLGPLAPVLAPVRDRLLAQLDVYYPRTNEMIARLDRLRDETLRACTAAVAREADESRRIMGGIEGEVRAARAAIDRIVTLQERMLAGLATLNRSVERFNAELGTSIEAFNRGVGPLVDALNAMWAAPDEAVVVCRKAGDGPRAPR